MAERDFLFEDEYLNDSDLETAQEAEEREPPVGNITKNGASSQWSNRSIPNSVKVQVIRAVKNESVIWNKAQKGHSNRAAIASAWRSISANIQRPIEECKSIWKGIRDSNRYHISKLGKSGSACNLEDYDTFATPSDTQWVLHGELDFLKPTSSKRRTIAFTLRVENESGNTTPSPPMLLPGLLSDSTGGSLDQISGDSTDTFSKSNYSYQSEPTPRRRQNIVSNISTSLAQLVEIRKKHGCTQDVQQVQLTQQLQKIDKFEDNQRALLEDIKVLVQESTEGKQLQYSTMYANLDRMLKRLPQDVVEELNFKFIKLTLDELKKQQE